jgi:hypothetical protein
MLLTGRRGVSAEREIGVRDPEIPQGDARHSRNRVTCRSGYELFQRLFRRAGVGASCSSRCETPAKNGANSSKVEVQLEVQLQLELELQS